MGAWREWRYPHITRSGFSWGRGQVVFSRSGYAKPALLPSLAYISFQNRSISSGDEPIPRIKLKTSSPLQFTVLFYSYRHFVSCGYKKEWIFFSNGREKRRPNFHKKEAENMPSWRWRVTPPPPHPLCLFMGCCSPLILGNPGLLWAKHINVQYRTISPCFGWSGSWKSLFKIQTCTLLCLLITTPLP